MPEDHYELPSRYLPAWPEARCHTTYRQLCDFVAQGKLLVPFVATADHNDAQTNWEAQPHELWPVINDHHGRPYWEADSKQILAFSSAFDAIFEATLELPIRALQSAEDRFTHRHTARLERSSKYAPGSNPNTYIIYAADDYAKALTKHRENNGMFVGRILVVEPEHFEAVGSLQAHIYRGDTPLTSTVCVEVATPVLDLRTIDELPNPDDIPIILRTTLRRALQIHG